jgi:hypothetical protein
MRSYNAIVLTGLCSFTMLFSYSTFSLVPALLGQIAASHFLLVDKNITTFLLPASFSNQKITLNSKHLGHLLAWSSGAIVLAQKQNVFLEEVININILASVIHSFHTYKGNSKAELRKFPKHLLSLTLPFIAYHTANFLVQPTAMTMIKFLWTHIYKPILV